MIDGYGSWRIDWHPHGFTVRRPEWGYLRTFHFAAILLPLDIVIRESLIPEGRVILKLIEANPVELLTGATRADLDRFKRRVSGEVLAAVRKNALGCADCAREAGSFATTWSEAVCPACHENYCRNLKCLRRLRCVLRGGIRLCKHCGTSAESPVPPTAKNAIPATRLAPDLIQWSHALSALHQRSDRPDGGRRRDAFRSRLRPRRPARQQGVVEGADVDRPRPPGGSDAGGAGPDPRAPGGEARRPGTASHLQPGDARPGAEPG